MYCCVKKQTKPYTIHELGMYDSPLKSGTEIDR